MITDFALRSVGATFRMAPYALSMLRVAVVDLNVSSHLRCHVTRKYVSIQALTNVYQRPLATVGAFVALIQNVRDDLLKNCFPMLQDPGKMGQ